MKKSFLSTLCLTSCSLIAAHIVDEELVNTDAPFHTDVKVERQGALTGNFSIKKSPSGHGSLTNWGRVSPGVNGDGQISLDGNYIQHPSGRLEIDITPNGNKRDPLILMGGTATLNGGILEIIVNEGNYVKGTQHTVIAAPTTGKFSKVIQSGDVADLIEIDLTYGSVLLTVLLNRIFEDQTLKSSIAREVAECILEVELIPGSDLVSMIQLLGTFGDRRVTCALEDLSPVNFAALELINARNTSYVANILSQHLFELCCSPRDCCICNASVWVDVFGNLMENRKKFDHLGRFDANAVGILAGLDYCFNPCFYIGGSLGYTHTHLNWKGGRGGGNINSYYGALYGSYQGNCWDLDLSLISGGNDYDLNRKIIFSTVDRAARSDLWGYFLTAHLGLDTHWNWCPQLLSHLLLLITTTSIVKVLKNMARTVLICMLRASTKICCAAKRV